MWPWQPPTSSTHHPHYPSSSLTFHHSQPPQAPHISPHSLPTPSSQYPAALVGAQHYIYPNPPAGEFPFSTHISNQVQVEGWTESRQPTLQSDSVPSSLPFSSPIQPRQDVQLPTLPPPSIQQQQQQQQQTTPTNIQPPPTRSPFTMDFILREHSQPTQQPPSLSQDTNEYTSTCGGDPTVATGYQSNIGDVMYQTPPPPQSLPPHTPSPQLQPSLPQGYGSEGFPSAASPVPDTLQPFQLHSNYRPPPASDTGNDIEVPYSPPELIPHHHDNDQSDALNQSHDHTIQSVCSQQEEMTSLPDHHSGHSPGVGDEPNHTISHGVIPSSSSVVVVTEREEEEDKHDDIVVPSPTSESEGLLIDIIVSPRKKKSEISSESHPMRSPSVENFDIRPSAPKPPPLIRRSHNNSSEDEEDDVFLPSATTTRSPTHRSPSSLHPSSCHDNSETEEDESEKVEATATTPTTGSGILIMNRGRARHKTLDHDKLQQPFKHGWRRIVRTHVGIDQLRTDIFYITPCSRRLRTFPEIQRYLQTRGITDLPLESFTFSRKLDIGEIQDDQDDGGIKISRRGRKKTTPLATPTSGDETIAAMTTVTGADITPSVRGQTRGGHGRGRGRGFRGRGRGRGKGLAKDTTDSHSIAISQTDTVSFPDTHTVISPDQINSSSPKTIPQPPTSTDDIPSNIPSNANSPTQTIVTIATPTDHPQTLVSIPGQYGTEPSKPKDIEPSVPSPSKQGKGRGRGHGRGRVGRREQISSGESSVSGGLIKKRRGHRRGKMTNDKACNGPVSSTSDVVAHGNHGTEPSVIIGSDNVARKKLQEEKRRALVLKARTDRIKKRADQRHVQRAILTQRKIAQRQRRDRERSVMKQARERQDKISQQREVEEREYRRQRMARQRELDTERKAKERTSRLLAHIKQQEYDSDRRLYQQHLDMEKAKQLKRPTEDLLVTDTVTFPPLNRLGWIKLPSQAFADLLMIVQFTSSFTEFLGLDKAPSLSDVYCSLYNNDNDILIELFVQFIKTSLFDPGSNAVTISGQPVTEVVVKKDTVSEVVRLFLQERVREGTLLDITEIVHNLSTQPLECLCPSDKVRVLTSLTNEIITSPDLCREVDVRMEQIAIFRREKWKINLKLKRFRSKLISEYGVGTKKKHMIYCGRGRPPKKALMNTSTEDGVIEDSSGEDGDEPSEQGVNKMEEEYEYSDEHSDEETPSERDELQRRIKSLKKKLQYIRSCIHNFSLQMRQFPLGQDRYARQYWNISQLGGIIVEGVGTSLRGSGLLDSEDITDSTTKLSSVSDQLLNNEPMNVSQIEPTTTEGVGSEVSSNEVGVAGDEVGVARGLREVEVLKNDMTSVWSMSRDILSPVATHTNNNTTSSIDKSHSHVDMEWESKKSGTHHSLSQQQSHIPSPTNQIAQNITEEHTSSQHSLLTSQQSPTHNSLPMETKSSDATSDNPVAMETDINTNIQQVDQSTSNATVSVTTNNLSFPWFSLTPRSPCETKPAVTMATAITNSLSSGQYQLIATGPDGQQIITTPQQQQQQQQQQILQSSGVMQYYLTPSGALTAATPAAATQQIQMGYALVGNTLVPQQYITTATAAATPQQHYILSQGGVQYVITGEAAGGLMGFGGLGGVAVVPQGGLGGQGGLVQTINSDGSTVVQALSDGGGVVIDEGGGAIVVGGNTTNNTSDNVKGIKTVAMDTSNQATTVEKTLTNHIIPNTSSICKTDIPMETTQTVAMETTQTVDKIKEEKDGEKQQEYITAVLPGQDGESQYVNLPADPRVLSGEYSYAVLQQTDGTSQIVLMENTSISTQTLSMECPPASMMVYSDNETASFAIDITLMVAEQQIIAPPPPPAELIKKERERLMLAELLKEQDNDITEGWWAISEPQTVDRILRSLSLRGYREKGLYKNFNKHRELMCSGMEPGILQEFKSSFQAIIDSLVKEEKGESSGGKMEGDGEGKERNSKTDSESQSSEDSSEDSSDDSLLPSTNHNTISDSHVIKPVVKATTTDAVRLANQITELDVYDPPYIEHAMDAILNLFCDIVRMKDRLHIAQLFREWEHPPVMVEEVKGYDEPLRFIGQFLLLVEQNVLRRYLKSPFRDKKYISLTPPPPPRSSGRGRPPKEQEAPPTSDLPTQEEPTEDLINWQGAVTMVTSASQLAVLVSQLNGCIAWEKSPTTVFCQVCYSAENENLLLLCDDCDKGTHTYCCKPKLTTIPKGDWFCQFCINNKSKHRTCMICDRGRGELLRCSKCPKAYHIRCLTPPLNKTPSGAWLCSACKRKVAKKQAPPTSSSPSNNHGRKKMIKEDMGVCHVILDEMKRHQDSWPFLEPVDRTTFPEYFKVIKKPMDFQTIKNKLKDGRYMTRESFAADSRLVFSNCLFYNEDHSKIGMAGHSMKTFFEKRWLEINR